MSVFKSGRNICESGLSFHSDARLATSLSAVSALSTDRLDPSMEDRALQPRRTPVVALRLGGLRMSVKFARQQDYKRAIDRLFYCNVIVHVVCNCLCNLFIKGFYQEGYIEISIIDTGGAVDIAYLDFSKAFDTVPHRRLINKLQSLSLDSNIVDWIRQWLSDRQQRVVVNGVYSAQGLVTSGVPQGSVLGPILFNIFISDIAEGINGKVCLFADDTKICNRVDVPGGISQMTNDLGKLKKWSELWQLSFNVDKCKIMHLGRKNPRAEYRICDTVLTSTSEERDLGVIISEDLRVSSQCNRAAGNASRMLGCVGRGISSRKREVLMPRYRALVRPHLEYCVQYWRPYLQKDIDILERVQRRATKMVYGLKEKSYQERLNDLNMYSLEKRRDRGDMIETFKYVKGIHKVEEGSIFKRKQNSKTRGHSLRLEGQRFKSNIRKHYFTERVVDTWNSLPVEVVEAKTVIEFKQAWDRHKAILNKR
uniref:Reverse transcriptase domain-containing protein n=1 Tax=Leptobrachium leishanense TaxID=445787 RepID=A0A8C5M1E9_9ANUR